MSSRLVRPGCEGPGSLRNSWQRGRTAIKKKHDQQATQVACNRKQKFQHYEIGSCIASTYNMEYGTLL